MRRGYKLLGFFIFVMIIKSKQSSNYTVLPNDVFNQNFSVEAIGLLAYLLSLPHDWVVYKKNLSDKLNLGREKLDRIFKELIEKGYIISVEKRISGKITYEHTVYDRCVFTDNGKPTTTVCFTAAEKPLSANPQLLSTNSTKENINNNIIAKKIEFENMCQHILESEMKKDFINYWTETSKTGKLRYEKEPFFDINRRFNTWKKNNAKFFGIINKTEQKRVVNQFK